jgi:hypothetical protein
MKACGLLGLRSHALSAALPRLGASLDSMSMSRRSTFVLVLPLGLLKYSTLVIFKERWSCYHWHGGTAFDLSALVSGTPSGGIELLRT